MLSRHLSLGFRCISEEKIIFSDEKNTSDIKNIFSDEKNTSDKKNNFSDKKKYF